jgi:uncharacterized protein (DUF1810 family)
MPDEFSLFIAAQNPAYDQVIQELANGKNQSFAMWRVLQLIVAQRFFGLRWD